MLKKILAALTAASLAPVLSAAPVFASEQPSTAEVSYNYGGTEYTRRMEKLDRGLKAAKTDEGVFLSWRLLGTEATPDTILNAPMFDIYRDGENIATTNGVTNFLDTYGNENAKYSVAPVIDGVGGERCEAVSVNGSNVFEIPLDKPEAVTLEDGKTYSYTAGDASAGDLDGDGEYEIILKWDCNPQDNSNGGITGNVILDAYKLDGTSLWRIDLGRNIRAGAHYTQFLVYDFDLDGQAELCCKTAPGSKDSKGSFVNRASDDPGVRAGDNSEVFVNTGDGRIYGGDEYYTYFESDGIAADTVFYPFDRNGYWGRDSGGKIDNWNRVDRYLGAVAYLDGEKPAAISVRGYYDRTTVAAFTVENGKLELAASHDTFENGGIDGRYGGQYSGQGNHNITVADVDNDGRDEILTGSVCFDDDLSVKWCSGRGHGDALHIGDYDPENPGLEYFSVHEGGKYEITESTTGNNGKQTDFGMTVYSASTGEELFHTGASGDTGRGIMANFGAGGYYQIFGAGGYFANGGTNFPELGTVYNVSKNFRIFWDGDLYEEALDGTKISKYYYISNGFYDIFNASYYNCKQINGTKATPCLTADLFGDWREEVVYPSYDDSSLKIFMSTEQSNYALPTLMHDPVYRSGVAAEQTAYNQPPHIGYYLNEEMFTDSVTSITASAEKYDYALGEELGSVTVTLHYKSGMTEDITEGFEISGYDPNKLGEQTITVVWYDLETEITVNVSHIRPERIFIKCDAKGLFAGRKLELKLEFMPENASDTEVTWTSSNPEVAYVDENGVVYGISDGEAVITASTEGADGYTIDDEYSLTVKTEGSYEQVPEYIPTPDYYIYGRTSKEYDCVIEIPEIKVYDQYGIEILSPELTFEVLDDAVRLSEDGESLIVPAGTPAYEFNLAADCGDAFEQYLVVLENSETTPSYYNFVDEDFSGAPALTMGASEQNVEAGDITYHLKSRGDGDKTTGFFPETNGGNTYQVFGAGRFSDNNRQPYITFNNAAEGFGANNDAVLTAKLCFPKSSKGYTQTVTFSYGTAPSDRRIVHQITSGDFDTDKWIEYSLIRRGGEWYELIRETGGDIISFEKTEVQNDLPIKMIDVTSTAAGKENAASKVCIDDLRYYYPDNAMSEVEITLLDEYGVKTNNAVKVSGMLFYPDENGDIKITLPHGVYTFSAGRVKKKLCVGGESEAFTILQPMTFSSKTDGNIVSVRLAEKSNVFISDYNDDGTLGGVKAEFDITGEKFYILDSEPDRVFVWDEKMVPKIK